MRDRIAQHVLQRCSDAIEHAAIHFALRTIDLELNGLAGFRTRLAQYAAQTRHQRIERHHARAHQTRSEEHTSELQSLMRISYAVFCLKKKKTHHLSDNPIAIHPNHTSINHYNYSTILHYNIKHLTY